MPPGPYLMSAPCLPCPRPRSRSRRSRTRRVSARNTSAPARPAASCTARRASAARAGGDGAVAAVGPQAQIDAVEVAVAREVRQRRGERLAEARVGLVVRQAADGRGHFMVVDEDDV